MKNIESIMECPTPRNMTYVRYFMGLVGYYRRFINILSSIAHPITSLQRKNVKFVWYEKYEASFQELKSLLTSAPILKIVYLENDFLVCMDSCIEGLGGVLMWEGNAICYESRKLKDRENDYATHYLELVAIVPSRNGGITY